MVLIDKKQIGKTLVQIINMTPLDSIFIGDSSADGISF